MKGRTVSLTECECESILMKLNILTIIPANIIIQKIILLFTLFNKIPNY
jgi:hypothetical protein